MRTISIGRRRLLLGASAALIAPRVRAQAGRAHRVLWLSAVSEKNGSAWLNPFIESMAALGYVQGRNLMLDTRWGDNSRERLDRLAQEAAALKPAVIVTYGSGVHAARKLVGTTPVVIGLSGDPIELGIAKSLARPGGHFTGVTMLAYDLVGKRVELLHEIAPKMRRLAVLSRPDHPGDAKELDATRGAAARFGLETAHFPVHTATDLQPALAGVVAARADSLVVHPDGLFVAHRDAIARFLIEHRIPSVSGWAELADAGMLITYGPNREDIFKRLAYFVDRILRGTNPLDLPIEQPTRIELVVNMKTAKALGVTIPPTVMVRAERVIA